MRNDLSFIHRHCYAIGTVLALFLLGAAGLASWGIWQCAR